MQCAQSPEDKSVKISPEYLKEQKLLHAFTEYGTASKMYAPLVSQIVNKLGVTELLDYGCGRGNLAANLKADHKLTIQMYDPAVEEYAGTPIPMQMTACVDVLEHIEPDCLDEVLDDLERCTNAVAFISIHTGPAVKTLSDGRNAHLIQKPAVWWLPRLWARFDIQTFQMVGDNGFYVIAYARPKSIIEVPEIVQ